MKDKLRRGAREDKSEIADSVPQEEGDEYRFLSVFEEDETEAKDGTAGRYMIRYTSHDGMNRSQSKKQAGHSIMTMPTFSMQVVNLTSEEVKELKDDEDVLYVEPGKFVLHFSFHNSFLKYVVGFWSLIQIFS